MTIDTWQHEAFSPLIIEEEMMAAEFKVATHQAIENNNPEFYFYGETIEVEYALDEMDIFEEGRIYH